ncbi:uncharacterized protein CDAR_454021 [Caerostris darwini]|uniref:Gustatory receptor n=1 Tax=Caerostris darwini TaxID=1538125 RepID=A0AAV4V788_9ARAC|nr:uncharacterized protein CDAR_454021 [Caerostris darwini]
MKQLNYWIASKDHHVRKKNLSASMTFDPKWYLKYGTKQHFLLRILYCTGLLVDSDKSSRNRIIFTVLFSIHLLVVADYVMEVILLIRSSISDLFFKITLINSVSYILSIVAWCELRRKRRILSLCLNMLRKTHVFSSRKVQIISFLFFFSLSISRLALDFKRSTDVLKYPIKMYGFEINTYVGITMIYIKTILLMFINPTWINFIILLYCLLCGHVSKLIRLSRIHIERSSPEEFTSSRQAGIAKNEAKLSSLVQLLQNVFSVPSFLISVALFCTCITALGMLIVLFGEFQRFALQSLVALMFVNSFGGLVICLWTAGGLPVEVEKLKETLRKKLQQKRLSENLIGDTCGDMKSLKVSSFVLSGCNIVYFQRNSILALAGTILTYTILLVSRQ